MGIADISNKNKKAMETIAEINDLFLEVTGWIGGEADTTIKHLYGKWQELMSEPENAITKAFVDKCIKLIDECIAFREDIVEKGRFFAENAKNRISSVNKCVPEDKDIKSILDDELGLWNKHGQPQLVFLFERAEQLELSIRDIINVITKPIEVVK